MPCEPHRFRAVRIDAPSRSRRDRTERFPACRDLDVVARSVEELDAVPGHALVLSILDVHRDELDRPTRHPRSRALPAARPVPRSLRPLDLPLRLHRHERTILGRAVAVVVQAHLSVAGLTVLMGPCGSDALKDAVQPVRRETRTNTTRYKVFMAEFPLRTLDVRGCLFWVQGDREDAPLTCRPPRSSASRTTRRAP